MKSNSLTLDRQFEAAVTILHPRVAGRAVTPGELVDLFKKDLIGLLEKPESGQAAMIYEWLKNHDLDLSR